MIAEGFRIRQATAGDAAVIARIHVDAWRDAYAHLLPADYLAGLDSRIEATRWARSAGIDRRTENTFVAEADGQVVGYAIIGPARGNGGAAAGEIYALYVDTDWREQGIGRALIEAAFNRFRTLNQGRAFIWCLDGNTAARGFYLRCGGKLLGERRLERVHGMDMPVVGFSWIL